MDFLTALLSGEVPSAPILMAAALAVAFLGTVGVGFYVVRHTPDRFQAARRKEPEERRPPHAA